MTSVTLDDLEQDQQDIIEKTDVNTLAKYCRELQSYENEIIYCALVIHLSLVYQQQ